MPKKIQSIERVGKILSLFTNSKPVWGVTDAARETGLSKGTTHNIMRTLESIQFLKQNEDSRKYHLGVRTLALGTVMGTNLDINQQGSGPAQNLASQLGLDCRIGVWDGDAVLITFSANTFVVHSITFQVGPRIVAYSTGLGRAILAHLEPDQREAYLKNTTFHAFTPNTITNVDSLREELENTRKRGYAISNEEMTLGGSSLGAPIFGKSGRLMGAISVSGDIDCTMGTEMKNAVKALRNTAAQICRNMGFRPLDA